MEIINHKGKYYLKTETGYKEVLASTDSSLTYHDTTPIGENVNGLHIQVPQIPQQFIEYYVNEYNKDNVITDVLVEYEEYGFIIRTHEDLFKLKINQDNTINIKTLKDSWSREEVITLINKCINDRGDYMTKEWLRGSKWIEQNL